MNLTTLFETWISGAGAGIVRNRSGQVYKPSVLRGYRASMQAHILPQLGRKPAAELRRRDVQQLIDELVASGKQAQTVRNVIAALSALYRWATIRELAPGNPCQGVQLPSGGATRERILDAEAAHCHIAALPLALDRAIWATAFFAGLRLGELQALRVKDLNLGTGQLTVRESYDEQGRTFGRPKSKAGARTIHIPFELRNILSRWTYGWQTSGEFLVFGLAINNTPFNGRELRERARDAWQAAGLEPIGLHEARHTYASLMIAAGVNIKTVQAFMGHSSITTTLDRYGHLLPGSGPEAAALLDEYLLQSQVDAKMAKFVAKFTA